MSSPDPIMVEPIPAQSTLEVLWQPDASATVFTRSPEGELSAGHLHVGMPSVADLVHDLYPYLVDHIARARLRAAGVRLTNTTRRTRSAIELFLEGLTAPQAELPEHNGYSALETKLTKWVDDGLTQLNTSPWKLAFHLDERDSDGLSLEVWLQASDDPTLSLPATLLWGEGGDEVFAFMRSSDPRKALIRGLADVEPLLLEGGIVFDEREPAEVELDPDHVRFFLRDA